MESSWLVSLPSAAIAGEPQAGVLATRHPATLRAAIRDLIRLSAALSCWASEFLRVDAIDSTQVRRGLGTTRLRATASRGVNRETVCCRHSRSFVVREQYCRGRIINRRRSSPPSANRTPASYLPWRR